MKSKQQTLKILVFFIVIALFVFLGSIIPDWATIISHKDNLLLEVAKHPILSMVIYFLIYVVVCALALPIASIMTIFSGTLFGFLPGLILASFASTFGATLAFLLCRYFFSDWVRARYSKLWLTVERDFQTYGNEAIFAMRLVPAFPFFAVNLICGLLPISVKSFMMVSQVGMLPGTAVYVLAGTNLAAITDPRSLLSPQILGSFTLIGLLPIILKKGIKWLKKETIT